MTGISRTIILLTGMGFIACGMGMLVSGGFMLPSRTPGLRFQFFGFPLFLLASSPLVLGGLCLAIVSGSLNPRSNQSLVLFFISMAFIALAFFAAPKV